MEMEGSIERHTGGYTSKLSASCVITLQPLPTESWFRQADVRFTRRFGWAGARGRGEIESYVEPSDGPEHLEK